MDSSINYRYKPGDYVEVVDPGRRYEEYRGRKGVISSCRLNLIGEKAYLIVFDGESHTDKYLWYESEISLYDSSEYELDVASEDELLGLFER
ncbi:MAG: hypothetical protein MJZ03_00555 [archaeon]|nr:hypothetical protein [archaeon]